MEALCLFRQSGLGRPLSGKSNQGAEFHLWLLCIRISGSAYRNAEVHDGHPLYQQANEFNHEGSRLKQRTMSNWLIWMADQLLTPAYDRTHEELLARHVLHADETRLQVPLEPENEPQSKGNMRLYRTSGDTDWPVVSYKYRSDRKA